jgi:hypothetical protein
METGGNPELTEPTGGKPEPTGGRPGLEGDRPGLEGDRPVQMGGRPELAGGMPELDDKQGLAGDMPAAGACRVQQEPLSRLISTTTLKPNARYNSQAWNSSFPPPDSHL